MSNNNRLPVCIIGAGVAGLSAAHVLQKADVPFVIVEGSTRIGGRVFPVPHKGGFLQHGATFVNGDQNEIYRIAKKEGIIVEAVGDFDLFSDFTGVKMEEEELSSEDKADFSEFVRGLEDKYAELAEKNPRLTVKETFDEDYEEFIQPSSASSAVFSSQTSSRTSRRYKMNCDCDDPNCSRRKLFQYDDTATSSSETVGVEEDEDEPMVDLSNDRISVTEDSEEYNGSSYEGRNDGSDDGASDEDEFLEPSPDVGTNLSSADKVLCATACILAHGIGKQAFVDLQRLSSDPIRYSSVSQILKAATANCEKTITCFKCESKLENSRSRCCSSQSLVAFSVVSVREVFANIVRRVLPEILSTHESYHNGQIRDSCGLTRCDRYGQVIETRAEFDQGIIRTPILLNTDGFSKSGCRGEVWPVFFSFVDLPDRLRWRASSYGLPRCATMLSCGFNEDVADALFRGLNEEFLDICSNPVRMDYNGRQIHISPSIYSVVADIAATVKIYNLDHWAQSDSKGCSMCDIQATRQGSRNVWELRAGCPRLLTDQGSSSASKLAPLTLVRAEFLHNDALGFIKSIVRRMFSAADTSAFAKLPLRRGSSRLCMGAVTSARLPTSRVRDLRVPSDSGRALCGTEYAMLAMTILPIACLNRIFHNDAANALCILLSMKMRFDHDPKILTRASSIYDRIIEVLIKHWDDAFGAASRSLKCHISLVHGATDYEKWGTCVQLSANAFESANRILKTNMAMTTQHDFLHHRFLQCQHVLDLLYSRLDAERSDPIKEALSRAISALSHSAMAGRPDTLSHRVANAGTRNGAMPGTELWHRCVFGNVIFCSEESQQGRKSDHSIVLFRSNNSLLVGVCQFFYADPSSGAFRVALKRCQLDSAFGSILSITRANDLYECLDEIANLEWIWRLRGIADHLDHVKLSNIITHCVRISFDGSNFVVALPKMDVHI